MNLRCVQLLPKFQCLMEAFGTKSRAKVYLWTTTLCVLLPNLMYGCIHNMHTLVTSPAKHHCPSHREVFLMIKPELLNSSSPRTPSTFSLKEGVTYVSNYIVAILFQPSLLKRIVSLHPFIQ